MKHKLTIDIRQAGAAAAAAEKDIDALASRLAGGLAASAHAAGAALAGMGEELAALAAGGEGAEAVAQRWAMLGAAAAPLRESVEALKTSLGGVADAFMNMLAPVAEALVPVFDTVCGAAIRLLNTLALLTARIFGSGKGLVTATDSAKGYSASLGGVAKAAKAARGELAAFDKLDVLGNAGGAAGGGGAGSGGGGGTGVEVGADIEVPENLLGALDGLVELLQGLLEKAREVAAFFLELFSPAITAWGEAFTALREPVAEAMEAIGRGLLNLWENGLVPLGTYLLTDFIPTIVNAFSEVFAPIVSDVAGAAIRQFGLDFEFYSDLIVRLINDMLLPALDWLKNVIVQMLESVGEMWATHGEAIIALWESVRDKLRGLVESIYENILLPLFTVLAKHVSTLWRDSLQPLWHNLVMLFGALAECVMAFLNNVLVPFIGWVVQTFGPVFVAIVDRVAGVFTAFIAGSLGAVSSFLAALRGLLEFLTGIFTGDWERAWAGLGDFVCSIWEGIQSFIKGIVNGLISIFNGMIGGVVAAVNAAVNAINTIRVDIPDWVPIFGGQSIGFSIPNVTAPQIPLLAQGAVIPPNRSFLAVLGDQTSGNNLEAPEGLIRQIFREELEGLGNGGGDVNIRFTGSLAQLARVLKPEIEREERRAGGSLVSGMV